MITYIPQLAILQQRSVSWCNFTALLQSAPHLLKIIMFCVHLLKVILLILETTVNFITNEKVI